MNLQKLKQSLQKRAETWRTNPEDPHNINTAVYVALLEVSEAIKDAEALSQTKEKE